MVFRKVGPLKCCKNLWPDLLASHSVVIRRNRQHWYAIISHYISNWNKIMFWVLVINERNYMTSWSTIHSGVELPHPLLFSYISQTHDPFKLIISVYKAHTSVVSLIEFKKIGLSHRNRLSDDTTPLLSLRAFHLAQIKPFNWFQPIFLVLIL